MTYSEDGFISRKISQPFLLTGKRVHDSEGDLSIGSVRIHLVPSYWTVGKVRGYHESRTNRLT